MVRAVLQILPEVDIGIEPELGHVLGRHVERIGLQLDFPLAAGKRFARNRVDVGDLLVGHREAAGGGTDAMHHDIPAGAAVGAVVGVRVADVERQIIMGVGVHLPGRDRIEALRHLHIAFALLRPELPRPAAHGIGLEKRILAARLHFPDLELGLLLVGADDGRRRRRGVELVHLRQSGAGNRLLGAPGPLIEVEIVAAGDQGASCNGQTNGGPAPDDGIHQSPRIRPNSTRAGGKSPRAQLKRPHAYRPVNGISSPPILWLSIKAIGAYLRRSTRSPPLTSGRIAALNQRSPQAAPVWPRSSPPAAPSAGKSALPRSPNRRPFARQRERPDQVNDHVIAPRRLGVEEHAVEERRAFNRDHRLFPNLALQRLETGLPGSTPPPGKCQPET